MQQGKSIASSAVWVLLTAAGILLNAFVIVCPKLVAQGQFSDGSWALLQRNGALFILATAVMGAFLLKGPLGRTNPHVLLFGITQLILLVIYLALGTILNPRVIFLNAFAQRIHDGVNYATLTNYVSELQSKVSAGTKSSFDLKTQEFPPCIRELFAQPRPSGVVLFGSDKQLQRVMFLWKGNRFRWGIEITYKMPGKYPVTMGISKVEERGVWPDVSCFTANH